MTKAYEAGPPSGEVLDSRIERLSRVTEPLLAWYDACARVLPWRSEPTPYRVWVSEIMLQQTRVEAAKPYFARFMEELPDISALAAASEDTLMKLWQGLGYYNRVRNMKKAAQICVEEYGGELPADPEALGKLPGIGSYTVGAISSIAFGLPVPAVDGNVLRVLSRLRGDERDIAAPATKKAVAADLAAVIPLDAPGDFNQALMELGATVCLPNGVPLCDNCPAQDFCRAHRENRTEELPVKAAKKARRAESRVVYLLFHENKVALRRRPDKGLLAGLWEFPNELADGADPLARWGLSAPALERAGTGKHIFSHVEWHMTALAAELERPDLPEGWVWADRAALRDTYALPSAFRSFADRVEQQLGRF